MTIQTPGEALGKIPSGTADADLDPLVPPGTFPLIARAGAAGPFAYLDSAASAQKPAVVLDRLRRFYETGYANIHRGVYPLSESATEAYEDARRRVARFVNAAPGEIVFTRGATEAINLVANSYGGTALKPGDTILLTLLEHHANIVPWQLLRDRLGLQIRAIPIDDRGDLDLDAYGRELARGVKLVAVTAIANAIGTVTPLAEIIRLAHAAGARVLVDAAQAAPHRAIDVQALDCDFLAFTGHKVYGPDGIGVLFGKATLLDAMPPWQGGGDMIRTVSFAGSTWADLPSKFEAGTPDVAGAVGLGAALAWFSALPFDAVAAHEADLLAYGTEVLRRVPGLRLVGTSPHKASVLSFTLEGVHPHDIGTLLDLEGVAVRTGHHCAQPVMERYGVPATARASLALYNLREDLDALVAALGKVRTLFPR